MCPDYKTNVLTTRLWQCLWFCYKYQVEREKTHQTYAKWTKLNATIALPVWLQMGEFLDEVTYHARLLFLKQKKYETEREHSFDNITNYF